MTKGALLQLATRGLQDAFLTDKPTFSHFKKIFRQYTPFAIEQIKLQFNNNVDYNKKITCTIPKKGDLLSNIYLNFTLPPLTPTSGEFAGWTNSVGNALIDYVELEIGGQIVDKKYGIFMEMWDELIDTKIENSMIGKYDTNRVLDSSAITQTEYYVPLYFWFHNNLASSIPLISLQHHEIKIHIKFRSFDELTHYDGVTPPDSVDIMNVNLTTNYVFLGNHERQNYISMDHKFFITQLQLNPVQSFSANTSDFKVSLEFNHPVSELLWVVTEIESENNNDWFNFSKRVPDGDLVTPLMKDCKLLIDGSERFNNTELFFRTVQHDSHHSNISNKHLYVYSFSKNPEQWEPSGTLNFSKLTDAVFHMSLIDSAPALKFYIFAINYNWFIIKKGMGGIAFSS